MSRENLAIARESVARFADGDMEGLAELYAADASILAPEGWPEGGRFEGREAVIRQYERVQAEWASQSMHVFDERSIDDWVVLNLEYRARAGQAAPPLR